MRFILIYMKSRINERKKKFIHLHGALAFMFGAIYPPRARAIFITRLAISPISRLT